MSIARRKDGRWIVKYKDASGAWLQKSFRKNEEDAAIAFDREKNGGAEGEELSMGELVILYLRSRPDLYHATRKRITWLFADEGPCAFLRDKYAIRLDRRDLEHMRENLRARGVGNNTINHYQAYTSMVLAWGADQELIARHPWRDFKKLKVKKPVLMPMLSDLQRIYLELPEWMQWAVKTAFFLAIRPGITELFRLEWKAFNFRRGTVTLVQGKTGMVKTVYPKPIYMTEAAERMKADLARGITLVCHNKGKRVCSYQKTWQTARRRAGVSLRFYDIRHIAASEMLARGADLASVAAQLGHTNTNTTGRTYTHVIAGGQAHAGELMPLLEK